MEMPLFGFSFDFRADLEVELEFSCRDAAMTIIGKSCAWIWCSIDAQSASLSILSFKSQSQVG
jgi:hypothetical protein